MFLPSCGKRIDEWQQIQAEMMAGSFQKNHVPFGPRGTHSSERRVKEKRPLKKFFGIRVPFGLQRTHSKKEQKGTD
jgi:hypothetical protein